MSYVISPSLRAFLTSRGYSSKGLTSDLIDYYNGISGETHVNDTDAEKRALEVSGYSGTHLDMYIQRLEDVTGLPHGTPLYDLEEYAFDNDLFDFNYQSELGRYLIGSNNGIRNGVAYRPGDNDNKLKLKSGVMPLFTLANSDNATCTLNTAFRS